MSSEEDLSVISYNHPIDEKLAAGLSRSLLPGQVLSTGFLSVILPEAVPAYGALISPLLLGLMQELPPVLSGPINLPLPNAFRLLCYTKVEFSDATIPGFTTCIIAEFAKSIDNPADAAARYHSTLIEKTNMGLAAANSNLRLAEIAINAS